MVDTCYSTPQETPTGGNATALTLRVAVATKGLGLVNEHFGHADRFEIYDVNADGAQWLAQRPVTPYCLGGHGAAAALDDIIATLSDCEAVLVSRIGAGPDDRLRDAGIEPVQDYNVIETALLDLYQHWPR